MSPNNEAPIQLPAPMEQAPAPVNPLEQAPTGAEQAPQPETASQPSAAAPAAIPLPVTPALPPLPAQNSAPPAIAPTLSDADDGDLIEKEWVNKAKQIVERNRDDPYKQSEELTVFKADYMKKRYNKSIKLK